MGELAEDLLQGVVPEDIDEPLALVAQRSEVQHVARDLDADDQVPGPAFRGRGPVEVELLGAHRAIHEDGHRVIVRGRTDVVLPLPIEPIEAGALPGEVSSVGRALLLADLQELRLEVTVGVDGHPGAPNLSADLPADAREPATKGQVDLLEAVHTPRILPCAGETVVLFTP